MYRKYLFASLLVFGVCLNALAQTLPFPALKCQGPVPQAFSQRSSEKALQNMSDVALDKKNKKEITEEQEFALVTTFVIDEILRSGKVLYGDTVTQYIQLVAAKLLQSQPDVLSKLNFFTLKSNLVNAISTHQGYIFVTTGLLSHIHNESELAFVLAHEIAHFTQNHNLESAKLRNRLMDENKDADFEERVKTIYQYSRENEMEADVLGMKMYLDAGYGFDFGLDALAMLDHADEHFVNIQTSAKWFESPNWKIQPGTLQTSSAATTTPGKLDKNAQFQWPIEFPELPKVIAQENEFKTHPDVIDRLRKVEETYAAEFNKAAPTQSNFAATESYFKHVQQRAWVEDIMANLRQANFVDVLYLAQGLDSLMPGQTFSSDAKSMAWYGLSHHIANGENPKAFGLFSDVSDINAPQTLKLNHVISNLNKEQISVMAVRNIALEIGKNGSNTFRRNLLDSSIKIMLSNPTFEMYNYPVTATEPENGKEAKWFRALNDLKLSDISGYAHFKRLRIKDSLVLQVEANKEKQTKKLLQKIARGNRDYMNSQSLGIDSLWMFSPDYDQIEKAGSGKVSRNYVRDEAIASTFEADYAEAARMADVHLEFLKNMGGQTITTDDVNRFAMMQDWMEERLNNGLSPMMLFQTALLQAEASNKSIRHLAWVGAVNTIESRKFMPLYMVISIIYAPAFPYYVYWQVTKAKEFQFAVLVFDSKTAEITGIFTQSYTADWSRDFLRSHLFDIMHQIKTPQVKKARKVAAG